MAKIPVFIFEEHNEAFFVWHYAIQQKLIPKSGNTLLHIDEHADMGIPRFSYTPNPFKYSLQELHNFTYSELTIENFIIPAIHQELFKKLYWVRQSREMPLPSSMCVFSHDKEGQVLAAKSLQELGTKALFDSSYKKAKFQCMTVDQNDKLANGEPVILDIDLDYFSCNNQYFNFKGELEISEEEYQVFCQNPHHFLRITLGSGIKAKSRGSKYFLIFNDYPSNNNQDIPNVLKVSDDKIIQRIDNIVNLLQFKQIDIKLIDICRSRISGFTPDDQCQFIEDNLVKRLSNLYELEIVYLDEIYRQEKIAA